MMTTTNARKFGDILREHRKASRIQLGTFAAMLNVAPSHLSDVELNRRGPFGLDKIARAASLLNLSIEQVDELLKAASEDRGAFELPVTGNPHAMELGAALMREWPTMTTDAYQKLTEAMREIAANKPNKR